MCIVRYSVKMWGRASMAAVMILILTYLCTLNIVYAKDTISESDSSDINAENILERATTWLWSQRNKDAGWGNDTHRVLLVLRLSNLSRDDNVAPAAPLELQLSSKQMELEIVLLLWRHREVNFSPVRLARYTLALNAMCTDPRQFHGHDLIGTLQHHEPPTDFEFALTTLAACNAQAHVRKRQIRRLLDIANAAQDHNIDTVAMVILALKCIVQDHRHRNLHHFVRKPSVGLAQQQKLDGSFGDIRTTALVMQALEEIENEPADNWNRSAALAWLTSQQQTDGSFGDVRVTAEALLGIAPRGLASIRTLDCGQGFSETSSPKFTTNGNESAPVSSNRNDSISIFVISGTNTSNVTTGNNGTNGNNSNSGTNGNNATNTFNTNNTDGVIITNTTPIMVNVSYTLWVGSNVNETYSLIVTAPKNETFYEVMLLAAEMSPHFQFVASEWPNGHYVHTIAGYKEEPMSYHYWLLYRLNSPPDSTSPPGNQLVAPGGVDDPKMSLKDSSDEYVVREFPFKTLKDFLPGQLENKESYLDKKLTILTWSFFRQGFLKQVLTEGERLIMTVMPVLTFTEQGTYEIINNLGSLAARFIFRPIEESGYFYFTQMVKRDKPVNDQNPIKIQESVNVLTHLCSAVMSIGLVVLVFGQSYSSTLLWLYGGAKLTSHLPVLLMRAHCLAILLLGINGVTECYTNATADSTTINKSNLIMIYESIAFLCASYLFAIWFGPVGFILGNCVNMSLRILHSIIFINKRYKDTMYRPLRGLVPKPMFSASLLIAALTTNVSHAYFFPNEKILHLIIGMIMFMIVLVSWIYEHHDLIRLGTNKWYERKNIYKKND